MSFIAALLHECSRKVEISRGLTRGWATVWPDSTVFARCGVQVKQICVTLGSSGLGDGREDSTQYANTMISGLCGLIDRIFGHGLKPHRVGSTRVPREKALPSVPLGPKRPRLGRDGPA